MRRMSRVAPIFLAATAAVSLALAACSSSGSSGSGGGSKGADYQVGLTVDLSGPLASLGGPMRDGYAAYFKQINASGGINGHQVHLNVLDDKSTPTQGVANVKTFISQDHVSVIGALLSNVLVAAAPVAAGSETPIMSNGTPNSSVFPVEPYVYAAGTLVGDEPGPMIQFASSKGEPSNARVGIIMIQSAALSGFNSNLVKLSQQKGWKVVSNQQIPLTATSSTSEAIATAHAKPSVIFCALLDPLFISAVKTLRQEGYKGLIINYDGGAAYSTLQQLHDPNVAVISAYGYAGQVNAPSGITSYVKAAKAYGANPKLPFEINGYAQAEIIAKALKVCGSTCSGKQMQGALQKVNSLDSGGVMVAPFNFSATSHSGIGGVQFFGWDSAANAPKAVSAVLPMPHIG
jgi:branched-chain amino acid transport system substrate-binding protein